ncbi:MAG: hypothetical protein Kow0022_13870 [Phycisphaerales bacterium]
MQDGNTRLEKPANPKLGQPLLAAAAVVFIFYACALPILFSPRITHGRAAADHLNYHEPVIHTFARQWPAPDLSNYHSATTPLYHLLLAATEVAFHPSRRVLMLEASLFTAGLLGLLAWSLPLGIGLRLALLAPMLGSMYVLYPGIWLLPDNAAWLGVLAVLLLSLRARSGCKTLLASGIVLVVLVLTRQIHLWAAAVIWACAWLGPQDDPKPDMNAPLRPAARVRGLFESFPSRCRRLLPAVVCTLPAFAAVGYFVSLWHGLVVPRYQEGEHGGYHGWNPATAAFHLAIFGSFAPLYAGYAWCGLRRLFRTRSVLVGAVVLALVVTIVPETTYDASMGRKSGLWNLVRIAPVLAQHTSIVLLVLAPLGAMLIAALLSQMRPRSGWIFLAALVAFVGAQTLSPQLWQRYHEPFILMMLALMSAEAIRDERGGVGRFVRLWRLVGPVLLGLILAAASIATIAAAKPAVSLPTGDFERSLEYEPLR